jgi:hypothetical protein
MRRRLLIVSAALLVALANAGVAAADGWCFDPCRVNSDCHGYCDRCDGDPVVGFCVPSV